MTFFINLLIRDLQIPEDPTVLSARAGIIAELHRVRGIGVWTAELTMVRGMRKYDVIPADDLGVRRCVSHYYCRDSRISAAEVRRIAERWGRWKGLASFYLIVARNLEMEV